MATTRKIARTSAAMRSYIDGHTTDMFSYYFRKGPYFKFPHRRPKGAGENWSPTKKSFFNRHKKN